MQSGFSHMRLNQTADHTQMTKMRTSHLTQLFTCTLGEDKQLNAFVLLLVFRQHSASVVSIVTSQQETFGSPHVCVGSPVSSKNPSQLNWTL